MKKRIFSSISALVLLLLSLCSLANYPTVPQPFRYVSDYTHTLNAQETETLEAALRDYGQKTSSQIAVVMISSTQGEEIAMYSTNLFNHWGIGRAKLNNGVLLLIAKDDRKLFITTGYGLEGVLPDAIAASIIRNEITPYFKQGLYAEGIAKGLSAIIAATQGEYAPLKEAEQDEYEINGFEIFIAVSLLIVFLFMQSSRGGVYISPSQADRIIRTTSQIGRHSGFGHRSGGGFGGSGGFGGGRSGGGGAGGSW